MITYRIASLLLAALILIGQSAASEESKPAKYRVELNSGERFVLYSGELTADSLIGTSFSGVAKSVSIPSISSLERSKGSYAQVGAGVGTLVGLTLGLAIALQTDSDNTATGDTENKSTKIPLKVFGCIAGGGLLGIGVGSIIERWEPVPWSEVVKPRSEINRIGLQFSFHF